MAGDTHASNTNNNSDHSDRPPAFLDLADSRVELKRLEHERLRQLHRKNFEEQMRMLEAQQAAEERHLLTISAVDAHVAVSAPTTPPRLSAQLSANHDSVNGGPAFDHSALSQAVGKANKRKSVNYAPSPSIIQDSGSVYTGSLHPHSFSRNLGAKSMPASRRTSTSSQDLDELGDLTLNALTLNERAGTPTYSILRSHDSALRSEPQPIDAGLMLDNEIDKEINTAMRYVHPAVEEDKFAITRTESFPGRLSASSAALDLAPLSGTPPRSSYLGRNGEGNGPNAGKSSEWPQFSGRAQDNGVPVRPEKHRTVTTPIGLGTLSTISPVVSRRSSPPGLSDAVSMTTTRSVPATPLGQLPNGKVNVLLKPSPTSLVPPGVVSELAAHQLQDRSFTTGDLNATLSRLTGTTSGSFEGGSYAAGMQPSPEEPSQFGVDALYGGGINGSYESNRFNRNSGSFSAGFDATARGPQPTANVAGSTALYHHHGTRYGLSHGNVNPRVGGGGSGGGGSGGGGSSTSGGADNKMNGLHGPKHKRGDVDREFNRFTGTRLEDLQGEIASLCKDQHGCRYLQKKLEEGVPEHRDIIFHETFGHFADLMTDPFGNYLCQKLVEYSNDEQRNVICESVAKDLVTISLNMHGTRAVQKMIDFLSTQRQIRAIIVALGLHVVTLIKDLNGNHVIQKCLNKLAPEDNQFIYNAVAQNCVEVATHRHGCCVLQRCIDHASDSQRVQLVQEITYNALTLVQDPYGNYVVQYILDLNDNRFSDGVIRQFSGNVCALSVQKFSSNVIEKCVRVAEPHTRKLLIDELLHRNRLEKLLRDSFGNYCVQTALDYAEPQQRALLVDGIRPILPMIRNTPYGKRIQSKLQREAMDTHGGQYSGYPQILSGGFPGQPARHLAHGGIHPSSGLSDLYGSQSPLYSNGLHQAALATPQMHSSALHALPHTIDPYIMQSNGGLRQGAASTASFNGFAGNGFASTMGVGDTQYQRYHYAM